MARRANSSPPSLRAGNTHASRGAVAILKRIGLPQPLAILATKTRAKRGDLLPEWGQFLREHSNFGTASTIKDTLRRRLVNLME